MILKKTKGLRRTSMKYSKIWPTNMCHYLMPNGVGDCIMKIFNDNKNVMHKNDVKIK